MIVTCMSLVASAQPTENRYVLTNDSVHVLRETEVLAHRTHASISSAHEQQTVTADDIEALGLTNVGQALSRMAGTQVRDYGGMGGLKTVSVHSLGAGHTGVAYDGIPVSDCQAGQIDIGRFFISSLESISLSVGQDDNMLQSASEMASGAMISLRSAQPQFASDTTRNCLKWTLRGGAWGEFSSTQIYAHRSLHRATQHLTTLSTNYQRSDGHYPFTLTNGNAPLQYRRSNTDIQSGAAELNHEVQFAHGMKLETKVYGTVSERGLPGSVIYYNNVSQQRLFDANAFVQMRLTTDAGRKWQIQARAKYNFAFNRYRDPATRFPTGIRSDKYQQNEGYLSATALWHVTPSFDASISQDIRLNTLGIQTSLTRRPADPVRISSLTALQLRYQRPVFSLNGSLLLTAVNEHTRNGKAFDAPVRLSPSLCISVRPWLSQRFFLRAMFKDTYRMPSFNDLYYDRMGNANLRPERASEWSVGMAAEHNFQNVRLRLTADGYLHRVRDKIVAVPGVYVWKMMNHGNVHISGVDATLHLSVQPVQQIRVCFEGAYTWQRAIDRTTSGTVAYGMQLPYTPRHSGNVTAMVETRWCSVSWNMQAMSERQAEASPRDEYRIAAFVTHDVNVWHEFAFRRCRLRLQLSACNITDRCYDIIHFYPMPGRHLRAAATIKL